MKRVPAKAAPSVWRRLHVRAALVAAPLLLGLGAAMYVLLQHYSAQTALEAGQRMNLGLARYVVDHQPPGLIGADGRPDRARMKELALHVMMINPAVEVYLLDANGRVLDHALEGLQGPDPVGAQVDLVPVRRLLRATNDATVLLPVLGTDPRDTGRANTFSVAAVSPPGGGMGYLYIVLNGRMAQSMSASLANSDALRAMAIGAALSTLLAAAVLWLAWRQLTRPLRQLTGELESFRDDGDAQARSEPGDEIGVLRRAVHAMQQRIAQQFQRLEDADRQRRELVSNISHDLRTPLSSIQGYVETVLVRGEALDAQARATHLRTALRHVELLGKRITDLFELSKLDAGRVEPKQEVFCLAELLQDVVQNYRLAAQQRGVSLSLAAGSHMQAKVLADIAMIERVLQNLIDNALRCTASGGTVMLAIEDHGAFMQISVSDTGRGIRTEHLPHIFERYWRATDADENAAATSSGLGLAIVKRILELHGSVVRVHSELARGTRFEFLLPQAT
ncbi:MAG: HAMP domain-containing histidine kinase [Burkholderiales bacterium]|nr:HAMP domain-containing histidine kinase [Burkholderiales bacterium]